MHSFSQFFKLLQIMIINAFESRWYCARLYFHLELLLKMSPHDLFKCLFSFLAHIECLTQIIKYCLHVVSLAPLIHSIQWNLSFTPGSYHKLDYQERTSYFFNIFIYSRIGLQIERLNLCLFPRVILRLSQTLYKNSQIIESYFS